mmetsp:Transcript_10056/g.16941  ORF Transcript_10056/g.16941 Transcript_10056/m.16941 type:complete len:100 (-) Transcript_10056:418-717(-)
MALWFKFYHLQADSGANVFLSLPEPQIKIQFLQFCINQFKIVGSWDDQLMRPLDNFAQILCREHSKLLRDRKRQMSELHSSDGGDDNLELSFGDLFSQF